MTQALRYEWRGDGWTFSLQRHAVEPAPGTSANLGAAPLVDLGMREAVQLLAVRNAPGERLWAAVSAPSDLSVRVWLADSNAIADQRIVPFAGLEVMHRFARVEGVDYEGFDRRDGEPVHVAIGSERVEVAMLDAADFDGRFGAPPAAGEPRAYDLGRLP